MPVGYDFEREAVIFVAEGDYPPSELFVTFEAAFADPRCPEAPNLLLDVRRSGSLARRSVADLRSITNFYIQNARRPGRRVALLTQGALQYGLMSMARTWVSLSGGDAAVFRDRGAALRWLHAAPRVRDGDPGREMLPTGCE